MSHVPLLVPLAVEALVVNKADRRSTRWSVTPRHHLGAQHGTAVEPPLFAHDAESVRTGITLHWLLPDGLTRGRRHGTGSGGELRFPFIPDRWLVVRVVTGIDGPVSQAWVLDSDYTGNKTEGTNPYPSGAPAGGLIYLGRRRPLVGWTSEVREPSLTAIGRETTVDGRTVVGDRDPAWAATATNVENVLAFHDDLLDLDIGQEMRLSYAVIGWYSNPDEADPLIDQSRLGRELEDLADRGVRGLTVDEWQGVMDTLGWTVGSTGDLMSAQDAAVTTATGTALADAAVLVPTRTICHGSLFGVRWTGLDGPAQPFTTAADSAFTGSAIRSRPGWQPSDAVGTRAPGGGGSSNAGRAAYPQVAIGTGLGDALAALFEYLLEHEEGGDHPSDMSTLFQALEHDHLDAYDAPDAVGALRRQLHRGGFLPSSGGTWWEIVVRGDSQSAAAGTTMSTTREMLDAVDATAPVGATTGLADLLRRLNAVQAELDHTDRQRAAASRELYALWWKSRRQALGPLNPGSEVVTAAALTTAIETRKTTLDSLLNAKDTAAGTVGTLKQELSTAIGQAWIGDSLDTIGAGEGLSLELVQRRAPRFYAPADPIVLISGGRASTKHGGDGRYRSDDRLLTRFGRLAGATGQTLRPRSGNPPSLAAVAQVTAGLAGDGLAAVRTAAIDLLEEFAALAPVTGPPGGDLWRESNPAEGSVSAVVRAAGFDGVRPSPVGVEVWAQPWRPLHLCWRASWYPTALGPDDWRFDTDEDYQWLGVSDFDHASSLTLQGRSLLATSPTDALRDAVDAIAARLSSEPADPSQSEAEATARWAANDAELAVLGRLKDRLTSADLMVQSLAGFHDQLIQRDRTRPHPPPTGLGVDIEPADRMVPVPFVDGTATTSFVPYRNGHLRVQRLWMVDAFGQVFDVIHEQGQSHESYAPLRGRGVRTAGFSQRSDTQMLQLEPRFIQPSRLRLQFDVTDAGPVRGWLMPNRLDSSLTVYDHTGAALGAVMRWHGQGDDAVIWRPAVGGMSVATTQDIADDALRSVAGKIDGFGAVAFEQFMQAIDRSLWTTDPLGPRRDALSTLVGRPIVVVVARCWIELDGPPLLDQLWSRSLLDESARSGGVTAMTVPVRLGLPGSRSDGTIGYFLDDSAFHSVLRRQEVQTADVLPSRPGNWPQVPISAAGPMPDGAPSITMLFDPRGSVHAATGLLPVKAFRLSGDVVDRALSAMDATFRVGPLLTSHEVRMPLPAEIAQGWSWLETTGPGNGVESRPVHPRSGSAAVEEPPSRLREGWLQLADVVSVTDEEEDP